MIKKYGLLFLIPFCLAGCLTSNTPAPTYYVLNPEMINVEDKQNLPVSVIIERPAVVSGLNTDRIALVKSNGRELDYFAEARWNGQLDKIVQDFIIESFENSYDIVEVNTTSLHQKADYLVVTKIRDFQAEYDGDTNSPPTIKVTLVSSILKLPEKKMMSRIIKTQEKTLQENSMAAIVGGFEELLRQTSYEILDEMSQKL